MLSRGRSFRTRQLRRLIQHGCSGFAVFGQLEAGRGPRRLGIALGPGGIERRIDGEAVRSTGLLAEALPVHVIEPGSHALVEGAPSDRRRFLDWGVFHVEPRYLRCWRDYRRILSQRNGALKQSGGAELDAWTNALVEAGGRVNEIRRRYVDELRPHVEEFGAALLARSVRIFYDRGWSDALEFSEALDASRAQDRKLGVTGPGPHRADLKIELEGHAAAAEASRGQQKLAAAALTLAQLTLQAERAVQANILLLDDPASELDGDSMGRLMEAVRGLHCQVVATALALQQLPSDVDHEAFHVERGVLRAV